MYEYCAFINVNCQLFIEQFHILFTIDGGTWSVKVQPSGARVAHYTPRHLAWWEHLCGYCGLFIQSFPWQPSHMRTSTTNCCTNDPSENKTIRNYSAIQSLYLLTKSKRLNFMAVVRRCLRECLLPQTKYIAQTS